MGKKVKIERRGGGKKWEKEETEKGRRNEEKREEPVKKVEKRRNGEKICLSLMFQSCENHVVNPGILLPVFHLFFTVVDRLLVQSPQPSLLLLRLQDLFRLDLHGSDFLWKSIDVLYHEKAVSRTWSGSEPFSLCFRCSSR